MSNHPQNQPVWPLPELFSALAIEHQAERIRDWAPRRSQLLEAVGRPTDMFASQWNHLAAMALDFEPDLIIELGRGYGNSTTVWTEVARWMGEKAPRIESICLSDNWLQTKERLLPIVGPEWFEPLKIEIGEITTYDFATPIKKAKRVLVFWDAHGFEVAECVLGGILPLLQDKPNLIIMHDMTDARHNAVVRDYSGQRLWRGNDWEGPRLLLGHIDTCVEQAISILDFKSRNGLELESNDHDLALWKERSGQAVEKTIATVGDSWSWGTSLHYFGLPPKTPGQTWTFPNFKITPETHGGVWGPKTRVRMALKALIRGKIS